MVAEHEPERAWSFSRTGDLDFTPDEPVVIREGVAPAADAIARVQSALAA